MGKRDSQQNELFEMEKERECNVFEGPAFMSPASGAWSLGRSYAHINASNICLFFLKTGCLSIETKLLRPSPTAERYESKSLTLNCTEVKVVISTKQALISPCYSFSVNMQRCELKGTGPSVLDYSCASYFLAESILTKDVQLEDQDYN